MDISVLFFSVVELANEGAWEFPWDKRRLFVFPQTCGKTIPALMSRQGEAGPP
jgi:hypothetical protein